MRAYCRVLFAEIRRVRLFFILPFILALASAALLLLGEQRRFTDVNGYVLFPPSAYQALRNELDNDPAPGDTITRRYAALRNHVDRTYYVSTTETADIAYEEWELDQYTGHPMSELALYAIFITDRDNALNYTGYLDSVMETAENLSSGSIFATEEGFSRRNIEKTAVDYEKLYSVTPVWDEPLGMDMVINGFGVDWLGLLGLILFASALVMSEKPSIILVNSTMLGRKPLLSSKVIVSMGFAVVLSLILTLANIVTAGLYYGLGDLSRPIQSVETSAPFILSAGETLASVFALRCMMYLFWGLLLLLICRKAANTVTVFFSAAALLGVGALLNTVITPYSYMNVFKYVNPYTLLSPGSLLTDYINLNIFGKPVQILGFTIALVIAVILLIFVMLYLRHSGGRKTYSSSPKSSRITQRLHKPRIKSVRLFTHENWRLYIGSRVWIVFACLIVFQVLRAELIRPRLLPEEGEYRSIIEHLQTLPNEQRSEWLETELSRLSGASGPWMSAANRVAERLRYLETQPGSELVYDTGWLTVTGTPDNGENLINALILSLGLLLITVQVREQVFGSVVRATKRGHGALTRMKLLTVFGAATLIFIIAYLPALWRVLGNFGLNMPNAASYSIPDFSGSTQPLWLLLAGFYLIRLLAAYAVCVCVYALSRFGTVLALSVGLLLFVFPMVLWIMMR